jgi:ribosomal protein S9
MASKPFSKMLGPNFKEDQPNDGSTGKEIPRPADKPSAIELMCKIIHHRIHETSHTPAAIEIHDLAIVPDKYDCIRATALAARAWIHPNSARDTNELGFFLISASIFALPEAFYKVSMSFVINHQGSYKVLEDVPGFIEASRHGAVGQVHGSREGVPHAIVDFDAHHRRATSQGARNFERPAREHSQRKPQKFVCRRRKQDTTDRTERGGISTGQRYRYDHMRML